MSIKPISSVSFNNYNNVAFGAKNGRKKHNSTSPLVIPLAALMAMSPVGDYAKDPYTNKPVYEQEDNISRHNKKVPLPSGFSYINKFIVEMPKGGKVGLNFIDNDKNLDNFEMLEYIYFDEDDKPITRGIVKGVRFHDGDNGKKLVHLHGIRLKTSDLEDYAPHGGMSDMLISDDAYNFFYGLLYEDSNNKSIRLVRPGAYYQLGEDMSEYRKILGL